MAGLWRKRVYKQTSVRASFCRRDTAGNETEGQYEGCAHEHVGQAVVEKEGHHKNCKRRVEEHCAGRTFQTQVV